MIARIVVTLLVTAAALLGDGAGLQVHAPAPPSDGHPPMSVKSLRDAGASALGPPRARATLGAVVGLFVERPNDSTLAARLLELARRAGREDWLSDFVRASARRLPTAATLFLSAELQFDQRGNAARVAMIRRAHRFAPNDTEIAIAHAVALGATGELLEAYAVLPPSLTDRKGWQEVSDLALQRLSIITAAVAPDGLGDILTTAWLQRSWRSSERATRARALAFAAALAFGTSREATSRVMAEASLLDAARSADAEGAAIALMNAAELSGDTSLVMRFESACELIPDASSVARADCLVSALQHAVFSGEFPRAFQIYNRLQEQPTGNPLMALRLGPATTTLLELNGEYRLSARLAAAAVAAAESIGDQDLEGDLLLRLARARRLVGDFPAAREAALQASALSGNSGDLAQQATLQRMAAERGARGEPAWIEIGAASSRDGDALREVGVSAGDSTLGDTSTSAHGGHLGDRGLAGLAEDLGRGLLLETEQHDEEALVIYLQAIDYMRSHHAGQSGDLLGAATLADVWQDVTRRALGLALASGRTELGLRILEVGRHWAGGDAGKGRPAADPPSHGQQLPLDKLLGDRLPADQLSLDQLPDRAAVVAYAVDKSRTWAIVLRHQGTTLVEIPLDPRALRDQVALWRELGKSNGSVDGWRILGARLASSLLMPIEIAGLLDGVDQVRFVPDDALHLVPFATLVTLRSQDEHNYSVSQFLSVAAAFRRFDRPPPGAPLVAFGASGGSGTLEEMLSIRRLGGRMFVGARATETAWKRESVAASAIHFGGHATPLGESPWTTALQLKADTANDGLLTITEILALPLRGAVVVLLGCDTAARPEKPGPAAYYRQVPSLGEAFLDAGASAVVGNLWPITEEDAQLIALEFYGAGGPARGSAALEQARATLRRRFPDMPRRWAGAVWLGVTEPLSAAPRPRGR